MTVRPATRADIPGILEIYNDAVLHTTATYEETPTSIADGLDWLEDHERKNFPVFVAQDDGNRIVGWSSLKQFHPRTGFRFTAENSVYVAAAQRGRGFGKRLLAALIEAAPSRGFRVIIAGIDGENAASIRLHAAFDFVQVGHLRGVGFKFGRWLDVIYMQREL